MMGQVLGRGGKGGYDPLSHRSPTLDPPPLRKVKIRKKLGFLKLSHKNAIKP